MTQLPTTLSSRSLLLGVAALAVVMLGYQPGFGQDDPPTNTTQQAPARYPSANGGGTADSNQDMIAVTGVDVTGSSVLYLIDTKARQLAVYQAQGGSGSTQSVRLVGARNIGLDLQLDGFNDKTEHNDRPLRYRDLVTQFESKGLLEND